MLKEEDNSFIQVDKLVHAVQFGDLAFIETALVVHHVSPDTKDAQNCSLLHWAAINNRVQIAELLIANHANVNIVGGDGEEIPLQWAVRYAKCLPMVSLLLQEGSNVSHCSIAGYNSLLLAVMAGNVHIVFLLLTVGGASPYPTNFDATTRTQIPSDNAHVKSPIHWLIQHRNLETDHDAKDILKLLLSCGADVRVEDSLGDPPLISLATSSVTKSFPEDIAFLLVRADPDPSAIPFHMYNKEGDSAWQVAWKTNNLKMLLCLWHFYLFYHLPRFTPLILHVIRTVSMLFLLQKYGFIYGSLLGLLVYLVSKLFDQSMVSSIDSSRVMCGTSWAIILSAGGCYLVYVAPFFSWIPHLFNCAVLGSICVTLWQCMVTTPVRAPSYACQAHPKSDNHRKDINYIERGENGASSKDKGKLDYWRGLVPRLLQAPPILNTRKDIVGSTFRICTTCLIEKSENTVHCKSCDICVVGLDHHCPFVNNCVGRGNRRMFVWFTFLASFGCGLMAYWSWYIQMTQYCANLSDPKSNYGFMSWETFVKKRQIFSFFACQYSLLFGRGVHYRMLALTTLVAAVSSVMIGLLFISQMYMVSQEVTTFSTMKAKKHRRHPHRNATAEHDTHNNDTHNNNEDILTVDWNWLKKSGANLKLFCLTGQFRIVHDNDNDNNNNDNNEGTLEEDDTSSSPLFCQPCGYFGSGSGSDNTDKSETPDAILSSSSMTQCLTQWCVDTFHRSQRVVDNVASVVRQQVAGHVQHSKRRKSSSSSSLIGKDESV